MSDAGGIVFNAPLSKIQGKTGGDIYILEGCFGCEIPVGVLTVVGLDTLK